MNKHRYYMSCVKIFFLLAFLIHTGCSNSRTASVTINLGLENCAIVKNTPGLFDRVLKTLSFSSAAEALPPSSITSIVLNVTGPGMTPIETIYAANTTSISIDIPAGISRHITVTANIDPANIRAVLTYQGNSLVDLQPGESKEVSLPMYSQETKLVLPNYEFNNQTPSIIQMNDISGAGYTTLTTISGVTLRPYDIAFDAKGRIYIANNYGGSGMGNNCVIMIDNITNNIPYLYPDSTTRNMSPFYDGGVVAVAVDMVSNYLYYALSAALFRAQIGNNTTHTPLAINGIGAIRGMATGDNGLLYIAGNDGSGSPGIFIYNTITQTVVKSVTNVVIKEISSEPWHVLVKPPYLYVANLTSYNILQFDLNTLQFLNIYGSQVAIGTTDTSKGKFYGPTRFVAIRNKKISIIDDASGHNKVVSMDDIFGTNWQTFPTGTNSGNTFFLFYTC